MWKSIKVTQETKERLDSLKIHRRQPYDEVIDKIVDFYIKGNLPQGG